MSTESIEDAREELAGRIYRAVQTSGAGWLTTVDGSPNVASYAIADELDEWRDIVELEKETLAQAAEITRLKDVLRSIKYAARAATGGREWE